MTSWSLERALCLSEAAGQALVRSKAAIILDQARFTSASAAVDLLNQDAALCREGLCAVYSASKCCYVLLFREECSEEASFLVDRLASGNENNLNTQWSIENTSTLEKSTAIDGLCDGKTRLLDETEFTSVAKAVAKLNEDPTLCRDGICIVFSVSQDAHVLLYRSDRKKDALALFNLKTAKISWKEFTLRVGQKTGAHFGDVTLGLLGQIKNFVSDLLLPGTFDHRRLITIRSSNLADKFDVSQQLGAGAQGFAYLVKSKSTGVEFVAKSAIDASRDGHDDIMFEFKKMCELRHPNCVKVIELLQSGVPSVIVEYAHGGDLHRYMRRAETDGYDEELLAGIFKQAMSGVAYLHARCCVHNDLKPDNLLVMEEYQPRQLPRITIADYGCARFINKDQRLRFGDPRYQSPENLRSQIEFLRADVVIPIDQSPRGDIWSMGVTLFELLSGGVIPFLYDRCTIADFANGDIFERLQTGILEPGDVVLRPFTDRCSPNASALLLRLLQKDDQTRPDAKEILSDAWIKNGASLGRPFKLRVARDRAHQILLNAIAFRLPFESKQAYYELFQRFSIHHTGLIGRDEFLIALKGFFSDAPAVDEVFTAADVDRSGELEFNEFVTMCIDWRSLNFDMLKGFVQDMVMDLSADGSGNFTQRDLTHLCGTTVETSELFGRLDISRSGFVSSADVLNFVLRWSAETLPDFHHEVDEEDTELRRAVSCCSSGSSPSLNQHANSIPTSGHSPRSEYFANGGHHYYPGDVIFTQTASVPSSARSSPAPPATQPQGISAGYGAPRPNFVMPAFAPAPPARTGRLRAATYAQPFALPSTLAQLEEQIPSAATRRGSHDGSLSTQEMLAAAWRVTPFQTILHDKSTAWR